MSSGQNVKKLKNEDVVSRFDILFEVARLGQKKAATRRVTAFCTACGIRTRDPQTENLMSWTTRRKQHLLSAI